MAKDKDKKEKKGLFGRIFGGKEKGSGDAPSTPGSEDQAVPPTLAVNPPATPAGGGFTPDGVTIESGDAPLETIPPGYIKGKPGEKPADKGKDKDKGKKGAKPTTPASDDLGERTMAPVYAGRPSGPATPAGGGGELDLTMPPGYANLRAEVADARAKQGEDANNLTMPPTYAQGRGPKGAPKGGEDAAELTMPPSYAGPTKAPKTPKGAPPPADDLGFGELTMPPTYAGPQKGPKGGARPDDLAELTMPPSYAKPGAGSELTMPPTYAKGGGDPFARTSDANQDLLVTNDPDMAPPRPGMPDPFGFGPGEDILTAPTSANPRATAPKRAVAPSAPAAGAPPATQDPFGFGDDVPDLLAPTPGAAPSARSSLGADPFGAPLADDPFEGATISGTPARPTGHKTEELAAAAGIPDVAIETFEVELEGSVVEAPPGSFAATVGEEISQEEVTLEMDRPPAGGPPPGMRSTTTKADRPLEIKAPKATQPPRGKPLFTTSPEADGGVRLSARSSEATFDETTRVLHAPPVQGGWANVPSFATVLADGTVLGRVPKGAFVEPDGTIVLPAPAPSRAIASEPGATERRVPAFPEGVVVDRASGVAWAAPDQAWRVSGSPEAKIRTPDGGVLLFVPSNAKWSDDGSYTVEAPAKTAGSSSEKEVAPGHPAHGAAIFQSSYLGCEETVFEDGWASLRLAPGARIEREHVVLPPSSRTAPGVRPTLLEIETRPDGSIAVPIPEGFLPEGEIVWIAPAPIEAAPGEDESASAPAEWGEPVEWLTYAGIEDARYANGWVKLDLPPGARVSGHRLRVPREYAHACDARTLAAFDREPDGALSTVLPADAEVVGLSVLIPPANYKPSPKPSSGSFKSIAPPEGETGSIGPTKTKSLDRFRSPSRRLDAEPEKKPEPSSPETKKDEAPKSDATSTEIKPEAKKDEPSSPEAKKDEPKAPESTETKPAESKSDDKDKPEDAKDKGDDDDKTDEKDEATASEPDGTIRRSRKRKKG